MTKRGFPAFRRLMCALALLLSSLTIIAMAQDTTATMVLDLDHASICGSNLDALRQMFTDVGLTPDFGGPHGNGVTQMALLGFPDESYVELIAPIKPGVTEGSKWATYMAGDAATCAWAVGTNVLLQDVERLKKAGIAVTDPQRGSRKRPDNMSIEWMTADVGPGTPGSLLPFMIEDQTPRAWRVQPSGSVKDGPLTGLENVVIAVNNLDAAIAMFRKAFGWAEPLTESQKDFGRMAYFPGEPVILASGGPIASERTSKYGEGPVAILLGTRDFAGASKKYKLTGGKSWFAQKVGWFDSGKLKGVRLGVIGQ